MTVAEPTALPLFRPASGAAGLSSKASVKLLETGALVYCLI